MRISEKLHRIRIDFQVTEQVQRFVYVYLIVGKKCYLIDSGVAESEKAIEAYMNSMGRRLEEIKAIFLTHAHPDHIGSAGRIKRLTDCKIYCPQREKNWVEDIDLQFQERPIPNFYRLAGQSVTVDEIVREGEKIILEEGLELEVVDTSGHSRGDVSYQMNGSILFSGDAIPVAEDFPILVDLQKSIETLDKIKGCAPQICCPAWDGVYEGKELEKLLEDRKESLRKLKEMVWDIEQNDSQLSDKEKVRKIAECMGWHGGGENPLFAASVEACRK